VKIFVFDANAIQQATFPLFYCSVFHIVTVPHCGATLLSA